MKTLMILAAVVAAGVLATTGCSSCCKKDGTCTKPAAAVTCTNHFVAFGAGCTNQLDLACGPCTNKLILACGPCTNNVSCTNTLTLAMN